MPVFISRVFDHFPIVIPSFFVEEEDGPLVNWICETEGERRLNCASWPVLPFG